jgi:hypothetical protein
MVVAAALGCWAILILLFSPALPEVARVPASVLLALLLALSIVRWRKRRWLRIAAVVAFAAVGALWASLTPSNDRDWSTDVAKAPYAEVNGDTVVLHNVRHFNYRTETDFDPVYETRTVHPSELSEVDIIVSYWAGKEIAHIMTSFGFRGSDFLSVSIETRKERNEEYSPIKGFFKNYELTYVVADERDVLGVRALHRSPPERVHILRSAMPLENGRKLFLEYVRGINKLNSTPKFYNTLTTNCTTQVLWHAQSFGSTARYDWKILLSGYVPEYLYENGVLAPGLDINELLARSLVTETIRKTPLDESFSSVIRRDVPVPPIPEKRLAR